MEHGNVLDEYDTHDYGTDRAFLPGGPLKAAAVSLKPALPAVQNEAADDVLLPITESPDPVHDVGGGEKARQVFRHGPDVFQVAEGAEQPSTIAGSAFSESGASGYPKSTGCGRPC